MQRRQRPGSPSSDGCKHPYPYDFFHTFERVADRDLQAYFRTWFFEEWALDHAIADVETGGRGTTVTVDDLGRAVMPTIVEAVYEDGTTERKTIAEASWWRSTRQQVQFAGKAVEVILDPDITTIDARRANNRWKSSDRE